MLRQLRNQRVRNSERNKTGQHPSRVLLFGLFACFPRILQEYPAREKERVQAYDELGGT